MNQPYSPRATASTAAPVVTRVETVILDLPTVRPHKLAVATMTGQVLTLVRVHCSDGIVGIGECTTIGGLAYGGESPESMKTNIDIWFAPVMLGQDATRVQALMARIGKAVRDNRFAKSAVETALLDAQGKRTGLPVSELLGGRRRGRLPVAWTLASGDTARDIAEAERMLDLRRHRVFKLKIGARALRDDIAHVAGIKAALGDRGAVRVDVNMAWSEGEATFGMAALADAGCELVEQPVASSTTLARLMRRFPVALMADESLTGPESAFELACVRGADVFAVKLEQSGGAFNAGRVAAIADAAGIGLYGGTMLEGAVGTVVSAHAFATFANLQWGTELFGPLLLTEEILTEPLDYSEFELTVPQGPGLGVTLDEDRVAFFARDGIRKTISLPRKGVTMLFHVTMEVKIPRDVAADERADILAREKTYSQDLQRQGKWRHIWRIAGQYANVSIFDVRDVAELHDILSGLPLYPFMSITVIPILRHPSAIREDDS